MICTELNDLIGFDAHYLDEHRKVMWIDTPFRFADGDGISVYAEFIADTVRYFDGGETLLHLMGRGVDIDKPRGLSFINRIVSPFGVNLSKYGDLEILSDAKNHNSAFASYLGAILDIVSWEREQMSLDTDMDIFVEEVAMYLRVLYPNQEQKPSPQFRGISGHKYNFDFVHGDKAVQAVSTHAISVSSALKKIIDINQTTEWVGLKPFIVIDDRNNKEAAANESKVLTVVSDVMNFTTLVERVKLTNTPH